MWKTLREGLGWTGTEDELLRELKRLAKEKGIETPHDVTRADKPRTAGVNQVHPYQCWFRANPPATTLL